MIGAVPGALFQLTTIADDPRFEGIALTEAPSVLGRESLDDDITPGFSSGAIDPRWTQPRLAERWTAPVVVGRVHPFNDYPGLDGVYPVFSGRAVRALADLLEPNGELLPLRSSLDVDYFLFNITTIVDALDRSRSVCEWQDPPTTALDITHFEFHPGALQGRAIVRLREWPMGVIVSDAFKERVEAAGLNGFELAKLWPLAADEDWRSMARDERRRRGIPALKSQTMVVIFPLAASRPSRAESTRLALLEEHLDALLRTPALDAPYDGAYDGSDTHDRAYRMFLTTPDVDRLEEKLAPWLQRLGWPRPVTVVKRWGGMFDAGAREETRRIT